MGELHQTLTCLELGLAPLTFVLLVFIRAPYGRHARAGWGPNVSASLGWFLMESPALFGFVGWYLVGPDRFRTVPMVLAFLWIVHYGQRTLVYPFFVRNARAMPLVVVSMGAAFNVLNSYVNGRALSAFAVRPDAWLHDSRFVLGVTLFVVGMCINVDADRRLRRLKESGTYQVPRGGLFRWVSCPNYLGEIIEWTGFALAAWSLPALAFAVYTIANLAPRARSHHQWYSARFEDYPKDRRALVPYLF